MEIARVRSDLGIDFPQEIRDWLKSESELAVYLQGDTLVLKKFSLPKVSEFAARKRAGAIPMEEIVDEVHRHREEKEAG